MTLKGGISAFSSYHLLSMGAGARVELASQDNETCILTVKLSRDDLDWFVVSVKI